MKKLVGSTHVEKFRKKLEQDLKKLNDKIEEICANFDNKLFVLFTKRLEYQYKIYEQENYIIKLHQSTQSQKNFKSAIEMDKQRLKLIEEAIQENINYKQALEATRAAKHQENMTSLDPAKLDLLKSERHDLRPQYENYTDKLSNERGAMKEYMDEKFKEFCSRNPEYLRRLNELDMMYEVENTAMRKMGVYDLEQYKIEIEENERYRNVILKGTQQTIYQRFKQIIEIELKRRKQIAEVSKQEAMINECAATHEDLEKRRHDMEAEEQLHLEMLRQEYDNIYVQMRFLKRMVELPLELSFTVLETSVLVKDIEINRQNIKIKTEGQAKITQLNEKLKIKNDVDAIEFDVLEKELEIEDLILESLAITRLKVTRQLQAAISNEKETEQEEKNLEEQIKTLKDTRDKRIKDMEKKEKAMRKEIESIKVQNETLRAEGAKLQDTVKERKKIFNMMQGKIGKDDELAEKEKEIEEENEGKNKKSKWHLAEKCKDVQSFEKAQQIAFNRRLFDKAKKLAQEFELLMQELKKLKAKTFPQIPAGRNNFV